MYLTQWELLPMARLSILLITILNLDMFCNCTELAAPVGEFFVNQTDSRQMVMDWRRTTAEQALFYRDHRQDLAKQYAGQYILLQMGEVRWVGSEWNMLESRRTLSGAHPEQGMWMKLVDPDEAEGEHFEVYENTLQQMKDLPS